MSKKLKLTKQQLSAMLEDAILAANIDVKNVYQNNRVEENVSLAEREVEGRFLEANRTSFERAEMEKFRNYLQELRKDMKSLKQENQKLSKTVSYLEKSDRKIAHTQEYTEGYLTDLRHEVRELNGRVNKLKKHAKESKKILQIFGSIIQISKPSDDLKTIRKKFLNAHITDKTTIKLEKNLPQYATNYDFFGG